MSLRGDLSKLTKLASKLNELPKVLAHRVAAAVAPKLGEKAVASYTSGLTAYDQARPAGVNGNALTLNKSGDTLASLAFAALGTRVRASLGTFYARYLVGMYRILPSHRLPVAWSEQIRTTANAEIEKGLAT